MHLKSVSLRAEGYPTRDAYPFCLPVFQQSWELDLDCRVTFFVGENGSGKSTFLQAIAHACRVHIWETDTRMRYRHNPHEGELYRFLRVQRNGPEVPSSFFAGEIFRDFLGDPQRFL